MSQQNRFAGTAGIVTLWLIIGCLGCEDPSKDSRQSVGTTDVEQSGGATDVSGPGLPPPLEYLSGPVIHAPPGYGTYGTVNGGGPKGNTPYFRAKVVAVEEWGEDATLHVTIQGVDVLPRDCVDGKQASCKKPIVGNREQAIRWPWSRVTFEVEHVVRGGSNDPNATVDLKPGKKLVLATRWGGCPALYDQNEGHWIQGKRRHLSADIPLDVCENLTSHQQLSWMTERECAPLQLGEVAYVGHFKDPMAVSWTAAEGVDGYFRSFVRVIDGKIDTTCPGIGPENKPYTAAEFESLAL